jgi:hypothetical protein
MQASSESQRPGGTQPGIEGYRHGIQARQQCMCWSSHAGPRCACQIRHWWRVPARPQSSSSSIPAQCANPGRPNPSSSNPSSNSCAAIRSWFSHRCRIAVSLIATIVQRTSVRPPQRTGRTIDIIWPEGPASSTPLPLLQPQNRHRVRAAVSLPHWCVVKQVDSRLMVPWCGESPQQPR